MPLRPKLLTTLQEGYSRAQFVADLGAGIVVGIVALPLAIAFGISSGATPEAGSSPAINVASLIPALGSGCRSAGRREP
ncbi:MAG: hypothetical protein IPK12_20280 [Gemmatimonadetes bacterium]|nr:hypothetical protein [Gemmatimonadota bacterium]